MRYILILALFFGFLQAKSSDACYSVQLKSFYLKRSSSYSFERQNYPSSCILVNINGMRSVRCGCYDDYREAEDSLDKFSRKYYDAIIVDTYKRRFENKAYEDAYHSDTTNEDDFSRKSRYDEYPSAKSKRNKKAKYDSFEDDFGKNNEVENEKSLYESEPKKRKRSFYGQEEEEEDLYSKEDNDPKTPKIKEEKETFYDDDAEGSSQNYYRKPNRDYARTSGRW